MLAHFKDYTDIIGDHPQNLLSTCLATNAYMLTGEARYKQWVLEYVDAWNERMRQNGGIIPTNIGLDGKIGSAADGKWYGGVYGWGFSVVVPQTGQLAHRNTHYLGLAGFMNAYLLTGQDKYLDGWRKQIDLVNSHAKRLDGQLLYPHMFGDKGWYHYKKEKYQHGAMEIAYLSMKSEDRARVTAHPWLAYLEGKNPSYPDQVLRRDLERIRQRVDGMRKDETTPDTRLADDPLRFNPASVDSLIELALGGLPPNNHGKLLFCSLRYFDPAARRAGLPEDVAALIDTLTADEAAVTLVNTNPVAERLVLIQAGGYGEHCFKEVTANGKVRATDGTQLSVRLAPGCGGRLRLRLARYVNQPTLSFPWLQ
jgi:hypothetical protein